MQPERPTPAPESPHASTRTAPPSDPALRDARSIAARIAGDEAAADAARDRYRDEGLPDLGPGAVANELKAGEVVHAVHELAIIEVSPAGGSRSSPRGGPLYLTSHRLLHRGAEPMEWALGDVGEMAVALERLVLVQLRDGSDLIIEVDRPRLLRVEIAAAIASLRGAGSQGLERSDPDVG